MLTLRLTCAVLQCSLRELTIRGSCNAITMLIENVYGTREFQCNAKFFEGADSARDLQRIIYSFKSPCPSPPLPWGCSQRCARAKSCEHVHCDCWRGVDKWRWVTMLSRPPLRVFTMLTQRLKRPSGPMSMNQLFSWRSAFTSSTRGPVRPGSNNRCQNNSLQNNSCLRRRQEEGWGGVEGGWREINCDKFTHKCSVE